ncbi:hypothetical protein BJ912DRAFT_1060254 [Pholiota molesta]|nr:hypothetical protein BJ912DRAFT_1060254 [Pholiota molesta]
MLSAITDTLPARQATPSSNFGRPTRDDNLTPHTAPAPKPRRLRLPPTTAPLRTSPTPAQIRCLAIATTRPRHSVWPHVAEGTRYRPSTHLPQHFDGVRAIRSLDRAYYDSQEHRCRRHAADTPALDDCPRWRQRFRALGAKHRALDAGSATIAICRAHGLRCALDDEDKARCSAPREASFAAGGRLQPQLPFFSRNQAYLGHAMRSSIQSQRHSPTADDMPHPPYASALDDATNSRSLRCPKFLVDGGVHSREESVSCVTQRRASDGAAGAAAAAQDDGDRAGMGCESERVEAVAGSERRYRRELRFVQQQLPRHPPPLPFRRHSRHPNLSIAHTVIRRDIAAGDIDDYAKPAAGTLADDFSQDLLLQFQRHSRHPNPRPRVIQFAGTEPPPTTTRRGSAAATPAVCPRPRRRSSMTTASAGAKDVASQPKVGWNVDKEGRTRRQRDQNDERYVSAHGDDVQAN